MAVSEDPESARLRSSAPAKLLSAEMEETYMALRKIVSANMSLGALIQGHARLLSGLPQVEMWATLRGTLTLTLPAVPGRELRDLLLTWVKNSVGIALRMLTDLNEDELAIGVSPLLTLPGALEWTVGFQVDASLIRASNAHRNLGWTNGAQLKEYIVNAEAMDQQSKSCTFG